MAQSLRTESLAQQYRALLEVSESIASHRDPTELFHDLAPRLHPVVHFDYFKLLLHDADRNLMRAHILEPPHPEYTCSGQECLIEETAGGWVWEHQQPWVVNSPGQGIPFSLTSQWMTEHAIQSVCVVPLTTAQRRLGALALGSTRPAAYSEADVEFLKQVANQVAVAVDNVLNFQSAQSFSDRLQVLLEVNNAVVSHLDSKALFSAITASLRRVVPHEYISLAIHDPETNKLRLQALDFPTGDGLIHEGLIVSPEETPAGIALLTRQPVVTNSAELGKFPAQIVRLLIEEGVKSTCSVPLISHGQVLGTLNMASRRENAFTSEDVELLGQIANQIALAIENAQAFHKIERLKNKLAEEKLYLQEEIKTDHNFEEIIGRSPALKRILKQTETVAPTDSTVLILGETGTGKELIARAIHNLSRRREHAFVKLNCAAIPTGLLESELFGHERGAFTGAIAQKIGRFELADSGTLFLDEVGDIPLELQPKLLRVLQEQEFERLGSTRTVRVNVRLIAATNADLAQLVTQKHYRSDLYYRLNVFPMLMPPLRERPEDVPLLVRYFAQKYARLMKKEIRTVPAEIISDLSRYYWPGNIRELENIIERAVILSPGPHLQVPLAELKPMVEPIPNAATTLEEAEREHILRALRDANWLVGGPSGAAARLGLKRTTLQARMRKLGITRQAQKN